VSLTVVGGAVSTEVTVRLTVIGGVVSTRVEVTVILLGVIVSTTFEITVIVIGGSISTSVKVTVAVVGGAVFTEVEVSVTTLGAFVLTKVQVEVMVTVGGGVVGDVKNTLTSLELVTVTTSVWVLEQVGPSRVVENTVRIDVLVVVDALQVGGGSSSSSYEIPHSPQAERQPVPQYSAELPQKPCFEQHFPQPDPLQETPSPQAPSRLTAGLGEAREPARARLEYEQKTERRMATVRHGKRAAMLSTRMRTGSSDDSLKTL